MRKSFRTGNFGRSNVAAAVAAIASAKSLTEYNPSQKNSITGYVDSSTFLELVDAQLEETTPRGTLAYLEVLAPCEINHTGLNAGGDSMESRRELLIGYIHETIGEHGYFCWLGNRFTVMTFQSSSLRVRQLLAQLSRGIAKRDWKLCAEPVHLTPILGYVDVRFAESARELWQMAGEALEQGRASLEVVPVRFKRSSRRAPRMNAKFAPASVWRKAPQWFVLSIQLMLSLVIGLCAPFIVYAICDALGADISGPIYLGVVIVLVVTATTIWIEGFLALKPTTPPLTPGAEYPTATMIIPAYLPNEADTIIETVEAFLLLQYPNTVQIIVAYNSPFAHMKVEEELADLARSCVSQGRFVIEPVRVEGSSSKAQNVNAVVGRVRGKFVGIFDADHHPHPDSLQRAWRWLSNGWDIVQGRCAIRNGSQSWVARMVAIEFEQIYAVSHPGRARFHGFGIFGGSNGYWRTPVLHETRMRHSMLTEDIDSSIRAIVAGYKIAGDRDLVSEELAPTELKTLLNQRLRWAQGWFQVSFRRVLPALISPKVSIRQKFGLVHLLVWRELFPWYSIQVVPIMAYWVWIYGWRYIHWTIPIFLFTTIYTLSTGPGQVIIAYSLAHKPMKKRYNWFIEYLFVSTFFFSPFKDTLSRIAHVKEAMRERAWKVTPRGTTVSRVPIVCRGRSHHLLTVAIATALLSFMLTGTGRAQGVTTPPTYRSASALLSTLIGGEASTINGARQAAARGDNATAARLFGQAIQAIPARRTDLLFEYANSLAFSGRSKEAVLLYRELLATPRIPISRSLVEPRLAQALVWSGQLQAALAVYDMLQARAASDWDIAIRRANVLATLGRTEAAVAALDKVPTHQWDRGPAAQLGEEILMMAARACARSGLNAKAKVLYSRAVRHGATGSDRMLESLDLRQTTVSTTIASPIEHRRYSLGELRKALGVTKVGSARFVETKRLIASTLTAAGDQRAALKAWESYLSFAPTDSKALVQQGYLLSALQQNAQALASFKKALLVDPSNVAARTGVGDENINLGRIAATENRNAEAESFFSAASLADSLHRREVSREYADQLRYNGKLKTAIALYVELLSGSTLSGSDRKAAMIGLARAYLADNQPKAAQVVDDQLAILFPGDLDARWDAIVSQARDAARTDRNGESADLFAKAIAWNPSRSSEIRREYGDQLLYSGQAAASIIQYNQLIATTRPSGAEVLLIDKRLAQAYLWTDQLEEASKIYEKLVDAYPDDKELHWSLLVTKARQSARTNNNINASALFARAIELDPSRSKDILREYGDQLRYTGRPATAIGFYKVALAQSKLSDADRLLTRQSIAESFEAAHRYNEAKSQYRQLIADYPQDISFQWHYLVASARDLAKDDKNKDAAVLLARAMNLMPDRKGLLLKEYADKLTYSKQIKLAIPLYEEIIADGNKMPSSQMPSLSQQPKSSTDISALRGVREAYLSLALAHSWNNEPGAALHCYQHLLSVDEKDTDAAMGAARMLSWLGKQPDAIAIYEKQLTRNSSNAVAIRGLAQAQDWEGHHREAQAILRAHLVVVPDDIEARRILAESLVSSGRPDKAIDEVHRALKLERRETSALPEARLKSSGTTL